MPKSEITEAMVKITLTFIETKHLREWFYGLERLPVPVRQKALSEMAAQIRRDSEDTDVAEAVASLANPDIYQSVLETVRERVGDATQSA
jgi:hypothetical protein